MRQVRNKYWSICLRLPRLKPWAEKITMSYLSPRFQPWEVPNPPIYLPQNKQTIIKNINTYLLCLLCTWAYAQDSIPQYQTRINQVQDSLLVHTNELNLYAWDKGVIDGDEIQIVQFVVGTDGKVQYRGIAGTAILEKKKKVFKIGLQAGTTTYLRMDALDMGDVPAYNTAFIRFASKGKKSKEYTLSADEETSAVFKLVYDENLERPFQDIEAATENTVDIRELKPIALAKGNTAITVSSGDSYKDIEVELWVDNMQVYSNRIITLDKISLADYTDADQVKLLKIRLAKKSKKQRLDFHIQAGAQGYPLTLKENMEYHIPLILEPPKESTVRNIVVNTTTIRMDLRDANKEDGDIITVKQRDSVIVQDYVLTKEPLSKEVQLEAGQITEFLFIPVSKGKVANNTTEVVIYEKDKEIHRFPLDAYSKKHPARLYIEHKGIDNE